MVEATRTRFEPEATPGPGFRPLPRRPGPPPTGRRLPKPRRRDGAPASAARSPHHGAPAPQNASPELLGNPIRQVPPQPQWSVVPEGALGEVARPTRHRRFHVLALSSGRSWL